METLFSRNQFFISQVPLFIRFVDDGAGLMRAEKPQIVEWFTELNREALRCFNIKFTYNLNQVTEWTTFLDINFKYIQGSLSTDINRKETDACRFLEFSSHHPRHTFRSITISQAYKCLRNVSDPLLRTKRLDELKSFFMFSSYDKKLVDKTIERVKQMPIILEYKKKTPETSETQTTYWVCTFGPGFDEAKTHAAQMNSILEASTQPSLVSSRIKVVARRAQNLKDLLFKRKRFSIEPGGPSASNEPCCRPRCKT